MEYLNESREETLTTNRLTEIKRIDKFLQDYMSVDQSNTDILHVNPGI